MTSSPLPSDMCSVQGKPIQPGECLCMREGVGMGRWGNGHRAILEHSNSPQHSSLDLSRLQGWSQRLGVCVCQVCGCW